MNLLIIGGTSFFGKDIVELALSAGHQVTICSRGNSRPDFWDKVSHVAVDRNDELAFGKALANRQFDAVIDNIAYRAKNVKSAIQAFRGNIGRYVLTSSNAVYMGSRSFEEPLGEGDVDFDAPITAGLEGSRKPTEEWLVDYAQGKMEAERALLEQSDVRYTILRPPCVSGPEDRTGIGQFYFQRLLDGKPLLLTGGGAQPYQPIYRHDLARSYLLVLHNEKAVDQVYNVAQPDPIRMVDWVELAARSLRLEPNLLQIPHEELLDPGFSYAEPFTDTKITQDTSKAQLELGFTTTPVASWTATTAQWFKETCHEQDSLGYSDRDKEVELAERFSTISQPTDI